MPAQPQRIQCSVRALCVAWCSALGRLLRQGQMTARTRRAGAIAASGCADPGAGRVELHVIERVPPLDPCCQWRERRKIERGDCSTGAWPEQLDDSDLDSD